MAKKSKHSEYESPRWQKLRLEAMNRDVWKCVNCGDNDSQLHVHHKRYAGRCWESTLEDLQTLCRQCHENLGHHPKGGVWWSEDRDSSSDVICIEHCPHCGCGTFKDKGYTYKCIKCGWSPPFEFPCNLLFDYEQSDVSSDVPFSDIITELKELLPNESHSVVDLAFSSDATAEDEARLLDLMVHEGRRIRGSP